VTSLEPEARERKLVLLHGTVALTLERHALEPLDCPLAFDPGRVVGRQVRDQTGDPIPDLKGEVGSRGTYQLADVLDRDPVPRREAIGPLRATQVEPCFNWNPAA
jgi:hypothetical protein